jgi:hypothetical protein
MPKIKLSQFQKLRTIYLLIAVLAVIFTTTISNKLPVQFSKYRLIPEGEPFPIPNPQHQIHYYD